MQLILSPTLIGLQHAPIAVSPVEPNYGDIVQLLGDSFIGEDTNTYLEDEKGDQTRDIQLGVYANFNGTDRVASFNCPVDQEWDIEVDALVDNLAETIFSKGSGAGALTDINVDITATEIRSFYYPTTNVAKIISTPKAAYVGQKVTIRTTKAGNVSTLYINGVEVDSRSDANIVNNSSSNAYLGIRVDTAGFYSGSIDSFKSDFNNFDFEYISLDGLTVFDSSGNDNHATLNGTPLGFIQESIEVESSRNQNGYNFTTHFIPRLETPENIALPIEQQVDILGNPLEFYGRVKYNVQEIDNAGVISYLQPTAPELWAIEKNFSTKPWYLDGVPVEVLKSALVFDYDHAGFWFTNELNWLVYSVQQTEQQWNVLVDYLAPQLKIIDADGTERIDADGTYRIEAD